MKRGVGLLLLLLFASGCPEPPLEHAARQVTAAPPVLQVPREGGKWPPSLTQVTGAAAIDGEAMAAGPATCEPCHADAVAQWRTSAHAFASFDNPIYRASVRSFRQATSERTSRFCAGCHDPALLIDGAMDGPVHADEPRARAGVTCLTCHSIVTATRDGNGSYTLRTDAVVMPIEGDPESLRAHRARLAMAPLRSEELCASCHRAFLGVQTGHGHHLPGADDYGAWLSSAYAGSELDRIDVAVADGGVVATGTKKATCRDCHMAPVLAPRGDRAADRGRLKSHRFLGGHTWLAAMRGDASQLERVRAQLRGAASVDLVAIRDETGTLFAPPPSAPLGAGSRIDLEIVVSNERVGHRFPGGTRDMHDVWIEVVVRDARGDVVASHGAEHTAEANSGPAHKLHTVMLDEQGKPVLGRRVQAFRAVAYDTTVSPGDSVLVPYTFTVPSDETVHPRPWQVESRLLHRSREPALQRIACEDERREMLARKGRPGADGSARAPALSACAPQPLTVVAEQRILLGAERNAADTPSQLTLAMALRLLRHGTAWQHVLVEDIDKARPSLLRIVQGLAAVTPEAKRLIGSAQHQLALVAARQGRVGEMRLWLNRAGANVPGHPALAFVHGRALASMRRSAAAIPWLRVAASGSATDPRGWAQLSIGLGSLGHHRAALAAAQRGLLYASRDPDLLRVQSLSLDGYDAVSSAMVMSAREAFLKHRRRDDAPRLRALCSDLVAGCARERTPAHNHTLVPGTR